jgi:hypothetical protein
MSDPNKEQPAINTIRAKSIEAVQATKSGQPGEPLHPTTPVTRRKRWHFASSIVLMSLGAIAVIVYLLRSALAEEYEGLGAALCAVACGGFLVWHLIHLLAEEDKLQDQQLNANQATVSPPEPNPAELQTNLTTPPPEAGQNIK